MIVTSSNATKLVSNQLQLPAATNQWFVEAKAKATATQQRKQLAFVVVAFVVLVEVVTLPSVPALLSPGHAGPAWRHHDDMMSDISSLQGNQLGSLEGMIYDMTPARGANFAT